MYLKDLYAISPQSTHNLDFEKGNFEEHVGDKYYAIEPEYLSFIPAGQLRRMGKAVKMGIGAAWPLLDRNKDLDGIIIGTANGGLEDCVKFLNQIVEYNEGVLTPTNFVQSTPNALAGQLALLSKNTGYNSTHVNGSLAFENALLDAQLFFESSDESKQLLIGSVEEISDYNYNIDVLAGRYKNEGISNKELLSSNTKGSICGEGATMFIASNSPENAIAEIIDVFQKTYPTKNELEEGLLQFLASNNLTPEDLDLILLGINGDGTLDHWYTDLSNSLFANNSIATFKQFCGEYRTASAFGTYIAVQLLNAKISNDIIHPKTPIIPKTILVYNHFDGIRHGAVLLKK